MSVSDGIYQIYTALDDDVCMDVYNGSKQRGANVQLWCSHGSDNQLWKAVTTSGKTTFQNVKSGMFLDVYSSIDANGTNIQQWSASGADNQNYVLTDSGLTTTRNGVAYPLYYIKSALGSRVLDSTEGKSSLGTNVELWAKHSTGQGLNQLWAFVKTSRSASLPTPSALALSYAVGEGFATAVNGIATTLYPTWICDGNAYQLRYRLRYRAASSASVGDWGVWQSLDGSQSDDGWGDAWSANCSPAQTSARKWSPAGIALALTTTGNDYADLQFEVRRFAGGKHGGSATATCRCVYVPTLSVTSVTYAPDGLRIVYSCDFPRSGYTIKISSGLFGQHTFSGQPHAGTMLIPAGDLYAIPSEGDAINLNVMPITCDSSSQTQTVSSTVSYDAGHGETITPTVSVGDDKMATVVIGSHVSTECWVKIGDTLTAVDESSTKGTYKAPIPFGVPYEIFCVAQDASKWDTWHASYPAIQNRYHLLNWDNGYLVIAVKESAPPKQSGSITANTASHLTNGLNYEHITVGHGQKRTFTLDGSIVTGLVGGSTFESLDAIVGNKCWYRDPYGCTYRVIVTSASFERFHLYDNCSLSMTRVDR